MEDIAPYWKIPTYLSKIVRITISIKKARFDSDPFPFQRQWIESATNWKSSDEIPRPSVKCCNGPYTIVNHAVFEWMMFGVIIVNVICSLVELTISNREGLRLLEYLNYVFVVIYTVEAILKVSQGHHHIGQLATLVADRALITLLKKSPPQMYV